MKRRTDSEIREEQSIHMEHEILYKRKLDLLSIELYDRVFCSEPLGKEDIERLFDSDEVHQDLLLTIGKNARLFGIYAANGIGLMIEEAKRRGLPKEQVEYMKRISFVEIANTEDTKQIETISRDMTQVLNRIYRKYAMEHYSYLICCAVEFIHRHRFEATAPGQVAKQLKCDRTYLAKKFKAETGKTLTEYIREVKMDTAAHLMSTHTYTLFEVSENLGYSSYTYFSKVFHKYYGIAPENYEREMDRNPGEYI